MLFGISCCKRVIKNIPSLKQPDHPIASESVVYIIREIHQPEFVSENNTIKDIVASGGVVASDSKSSDILTAGHACHSNLIGTEFLQIEYYAFSIHGSYYKADIVSIDLENDLCLLRINFPLPSIKIAKNPPQIGDKIYTAGYPAGLYQTGYMHFFDGYFSGSKADNVAIWTFPATHGSSGSLVINKNGKIIGIISSVLVEFHHLVMGPSLVSVKEFLHKSKNCGVYNVCYI